MYKAKVYQAKPFLGTVHELKTLQKIRLSQPVLNIYSVTQSFANSFWGNVVLDSFNIVSRDEDNILDQIYVKQICPDFYHDDFWFS